jgi:transposase-like protein
MKVVSVIHFIPLDMEAWMTRFCMQCDRIIGEKCVQCGTEATANSNGHALSGAEFDCPSCGYHFAQGDGGETGGMCEPCFDAELQKAQEQLALCKDSGLDWRPENRHPAIDSTDFGL